MIQLLLLLAAATLFAGSMSAADDPWVRYEGGEGPGRGRHVVLVSGDEEYRSEEALPQLAKILATRHGFTCTVLFAIDPATGTIDPENRRNIPGLETLADADLMIIATRFRDLPDEQMAWIDRYVRAGKPIIGMRTATHAFKLDTSPTFRRYTWNAGDEGFEQGFGRQILGETWIAHHGHHGRESTRGVVAPDAKTHPIARGLEPGSIWGPTDVYAVRLPLPGDSRTIVLGQVLAGMSPDDDPVASGKNDPMMPLAWIRTYRIDDGPRGRVFTTTLGAATDLVANGSRRLLVNATYWALGLEDRIPAGGTDAQLVGPYAPTDFGFGKHRRDVRPSDHALEMPETP
jgi:hypothetical protein